MCDYCEHFHNSRDREKLEYIGSRIVEYNERHYYRCPECDQAFYWMDWCHPYHHHLEILKVKAAEIKELLE
jgi:hypothetical protein